MNDDTLEPVLESEKSRVRTEILIPRYKLFEVIESDRGFVHVKCQTFKNVFLNGLPLYKLYMNHKVFLYIYG